MTTIETLLRASIDLAKQRKVIALQKRVIDDQRAEITLLQSRLRLKLLKLQKIEGQHRAADIANLM
jgi:uncharacterized coiled-coil protein SlyX